MSAVRDRVQAIADELRPKLKATLADECPVWTERFDAGVGFVVGLPDAATVAAKFCAARLLDALDTIDTVREIHGTPMASHPELCSQCSRYRPCPTEVALNGGNE